MKEELKYVLEEGGEVSVMTSGTTMMLLWYASNLDLELKVRELCQVLTNYGCNNNRSCCSRKVIFWSGRRAGSSR